MKAIRPTLLLLLTAAALPEHGPAQQRPLAITNARIVTVSGKTIPRGTVLVREGKVVAVGADVEVPAGARVVDARGGTLMPGLVSVWSRAGLSSSGSRTSQVVRIGRFRRFRSSSSRSASAVNRAAAKVADQLYARQPVFGQLLRQGVTTLGLTPSGGGFPGQGAVVDPGGKTHEEMVRDAQAFVAVVPALGTNNKKLVADALAKAKKALEERKKPKTPPAQKKPDQKPDAKDAKGKPAPEKGEKGKEEKKEKEEKGKGKPPQGGKAAAATAKAAAKPKPKPKDPNIEVLADLLDGKRRALVEISTARDLVHALDTLKDVRFPKQVLVAPRYDASAGRLDEVEDRLKKLGAKIVVLSTDLTTPAFQSALLNPAAALAKKGYEIAFLVGDSRDQVRALWFRLMELVRCGLPREVALRAVTLTPAKALGLEQRVGSIEKGKDADLLLFSADPLDPTARLLRVWHRGAEVHDDEEEIR